MGQCVLQGWNFEYSFIPMHLSHRYDKQSYWLLQWEGTAAVTALGSRPGASPWFQWLHASTHQTNLMCS